MYGSSLVTGWATLHGYPIGILANARGVLFSEESQKATQFIQLANRSDTPLLFLHNTTGYMVGKDYEEGGMIKHGAMMINAVSNSTVPHISLLIGASYGAGHYGMCGRAYDPRFLFAWPSAKSAVMGGAQLAGVLSIVARAAAEARGGTVDEDADAAHARRRRGPDRSRVAADVPVRAALRRRGDRPARHPHGAGNRACPPSPMARSRGRRTSASSGCEHPMMITRVLVANRGEIARRVFATCRTARPRHRRRLHRSRRRRTACRRGRRPGAAAEARHRLSRTPRPVIAAAHGRRCRRGPPRLRIPLGERRIRGRGAATPA